MRHFDCQMVGGHQGGEGEGEGEREVEGEREGEGVCRAWEFLPV